MTLKKRKNKQISIQRGKSQHRGEDEGMGRQA